MLPFPQKILFLVFALVCLGLGARGFYRLYRRLARGRQDTDARTNHLAGRLWYALVTMLLQSRTFRKRPWVSFFHSFIFYGFMFYLLVNLVDAIDGFYPLSFRRLGLAGNLYVLCADLLSAGVLVGVIALVLRRFLLPARRDFTFNERTMLHKDVQRKYISFDSVFVSTFILFHVGSRAVGAGAALAALGPDRYAPFATLVSHLFNPHNAYTWRVFGYWGALGSVLAFLMYFPYSKHLHIFMAPAKYVVARDVSSGVLPAVVLDMDSDAPQLGASKLEDLAWPRLVDAYACIQCNRCQDVCPATATGKALSPSALEINKRMELNDISRNLPAFETGAPSPRPLLQFALSPEAAWACTTCGACIDVCPVQDEPMLDIIDVRRHQVMIEGEFPAQLQTAFRGMERAKNPWGINHEKRLDWAEGLHVPTTDEKPEPDVLFWVGCAPSYDPQSQKTARAFVQLMDHAGVDFAVLGKRECCTGDSARRAGNEYLYRQLADQNVATLNAVKPKLIVTTCPHCMNAVGKEYAQLGGDYKVLHHTEYLEGLVKSGKLAADAGSATVTYHDPCYLGRHNGVYDAPRNLLKILSNDVVEMPRNKENGFCCGAGGAQFWKEEEHGTERISDNRYREAQQTLARADEGTDKVLAVGCPFCKSMLESTPGKGETPVAVRDVAELLLEGVRRKSGEPVVITTIKAIETTAAKPMLVTAAPVSEVQTAAAVPSVPATQEPVVATPNERKKWTPKSPSPIPESAVASPASDTPVESVTTVAVETITSPGRKKWSPQPVSPAVPVVASVPITPEAGEPSASPLPAPERKKWAPKLGANPAESGAIDSVTNVASEQPAGAAAPAPEAPQRKAWKPKQSTQSSAPVSEQAEQTVSAPPSQVPLDAAPTAVARKPWKPAIKSKPLEKEFSESE